jgi:hypothetical protein
MATIKTFKFQTSNLNIYFTGNPKAPVIHSSEVINSSSILVKWKAVKKVAMPLLNYTVYYNADNEKRLHAISVSVKNTDNYEYRLTKLNQLTTYSIAVSATNVFGEGTLSEPVVEKTSPIGECKRIIIALLIDVRHLDSVFVLS